MAVASLDFSNLFYNLTYGEHFQIGVYVDCKPCPTRYQCDYAMEPPTCASPSVAQQTINYNNCLQEHTLTSCMTPSGIPAPCGNSSIQANSTFQEPDMFKCDSIPYFCDAQLKQKLVWKSVIDPKTGAAEHFFVFLSDLHLCVSSWSIFFVWRGVL